MQVIKEYCAARGYELVIIYSDEGSAKNIKGRPEFIKMYNHFLADPEIEYVIVYKLDRAFRKLLDSLYFWDKIKENNKYFISILDNINTIDPHSKATYIFSALHAERERENTLLRTSGGMEVKAAQGFFMVV
ncbi:recombinase family protein [Bacillus atrophaeus]|uniref:recombinase family protein n=1 Tax=Bacillus atrophaeus TaxID=1452 RepID=UPI002E13DAA6